MFRLAVAALLFIVLFPVRAQERPKNVILMVADGVGPSAPALARRVLERPLALDGYLSGSIATTSTSHEITDSAASATAYSCGVRSYKGSVGVDSTGAPCRTILEAAEARGMASGLVTTAYITDATPGAFSAHALNRAEKESIADQMLKQGIEVILGGGRRRFLPPPVGTRNDGRDLLDEARVAGYDVITSPSELQTASAPLLGIFATSTMDFEIDRNPTYEPSLAEMTAKALSVLGEAPDGFFLLVETEGTDDGGHSRDGAALAREIESFDDVFRMVVEFAENDGNTLVIALSDQPEILRGVTRSARWMQRQVGEGANPIDTFKGATGISDLSDNEIALIERVETLAEYRNVFATLMSERAGIGWSTSGHTEADVPLYSFGPGSELFRGHMANDEVGRRLFEVMGL